MNTKLIVAVILGLAAVASAAVSSSNSNFYGITAHGWDRQARVAPNHHMKLVFAIRLRNVDTLEQIVTDISDPKSPNFLNYLTLEQVQELTGDSEAAKTVYEWLVSSGVPEASITITPGFDFILVNDHAKVFEALLNTQFYHFVHPRTGRKTVAVGSETSYALPESIAPLVSFISHTHLFPSAAPRSARRSLPFLKASGEQDWPPGYVYPQKLWSVYGISPSRVSNTQSTTSVFENLQQSYAPADLTMFEQQMSLPTQRIVKVIGPNNASDCVPEPDNCGEADLDVEYLIGVAGGSPLTFWSIDNSDPSPFLDWIIAVGQDKTAPLVHSVSYGDIESYDDPNTMNRFNQAVAQLSARGITVIVASGDDGVANFIARGNASACGFNPSFPASATWVTAVGATQGPENNTAEIACTSATGGGITTGGGFSGVFSQPSWQASAVSNFISQANSNGLLPPTNQFNQGGRGYPDVAVLGHNYITVLGGQLSGADGTSASAPVFAGMIAIINSERISQGKKPLGFLNQIIYNLANSNPSAFNDITSGENNCAAGEPGQQTCCQYGFTAQQGWDPVTGWGSINFGAFSQALIAL